MVTNTREVRGRPAFTKVELVVVLVIGLIGCQLLVGCQRRLRDDGVIPTCTNNLRQIGLGVQNYQSTFGRLPPLYGGSDGKAAQNSLKSPNVWASTHVFLLPYIEQDRLFTSMASPDVPTVFDLTTVYDPTTNGGPANTKGVTTYVCPLDPGVKDGILSGGTLGGTSYAANAQVFAPLADETIDGGAMYPAGHRNFTDRSVSIEKLKDGSSNIIIFIHCYALCGSPNTGAAWGYGAGVDQPPSPVQSFQPWLRASYLGQSYRAKEGDPIFQIKPQIASCVPGMPATPHEAGVLRVAMGDGSVRSVVPSISADIWNKACLPNDGFTLPADW
jgi:hypothetical protein